MLSCGNEFCSHGDVIFGWHPDAAKDMLKSTGALNQAGQATNKYMPVGPLKKEPCQVEHFNDNLERCYDEGNGCLGPNAYPTRPPRITYP